MTPNDKGRPFSARVAGVPGRAKAWLIRGVLTVALAATALGARAGVVFTNLYSFGVFTNGAFPQATLAPGSDGWFYGTTHGGGTNTGSGTVFKVSANGAFSLLHTFTGSNDGANPWVGLVEGKDGNFYGTTAGGGSNGYGTVFKITTNGAFTKLYAFTGGADGGNPQASLAQGTNGFFYGTTIVGGTAFGIVGHGAVFKISSTGAFTKLYAFTGGVDGAQPYGGLIEAGDGFFYGTTLSGGTNRAGAIFKLSASGALTPLYSFLGGDSGASPYATLVQDTNGFLYGTTYVGGHYGRGLVFRINTAGAFNVLYPFHTNEAANPYAGLASGNDGNLYGASFYGGSNDFGVVYKISLQGAYSNLYFFTNGIDGASPYGGLALGADGNFYGTTVGGGTNGLGNIFRISAGGALTPVYSFPGGPDGAEPEAGLVSGNDGNFYGTTSGGGSNNWGVVFKISPGGALTNLYLFTGGNDGGSPKGLVRGSNGAFYGTTFFGGSNGLGVVFNISAAGEFTDLYSFTGGTDGARPNAALVEGGNGFFYGVASEGGNTNVISSGSGAVFQIDAGGALTPLYDFAGGNDGGTPEGSLVQGADGNFYGTTSAGGTNGLGTVFRIDSAGTLTPLHDFTGGNDGASPYAGLIQGSDGWFYGTASSGGVGVGTVFKINASGMFSNLYSFTAGNDGGWPDAPLAQGNDGNYYGTAAFGGAFSSYGTLFKISPVGTLTTLYSFTGGNDGGIPQAGLVQGSDASFYGTTFHGGMGGRGAVFRLSVGLLPNPVITNVDGNLAVPTNDFSFEVRAIDGSEIVVQACTNLNNPTWTPLATNTLNGILTHFRDPEWMNFPGRIYRAQLH